TAADAWEALCRRWEHKTSIGKKELWKQLTEVNLQPGKDPVKLFVRIRRIISMLKKVGASIDQDMLLHITMQALPEEYEPMVSAMEAASDLEVDFNALQERVVHYFNTRIRPKKTSNNSYPTEEYHQKATRYPTEGYQRNNSKFQQKKPQWMASIECFKCHKKGHIARDCTA
ncbi:unnamed protein product, partial [Chrysoparadoxa australica]